MLDKIIEKLIEKRKEEISASTFKIDAYKESWNSLKDRLINLYSEMSIEAVITNNETALTPAQITLLAKWSMLSDIVNIMSQIERENIK